MMRYSIVAVHRPRHGPSGRPRYLTHELERVGTPPFATANTRVRIMRWHYPLAPYQPYVHHDSSLFPFNTPSTNVLYVTRFSSNWHLTPAKFPHISIAKGDREP